jgi:hypothetical protein
VDESYRGRCNTHWRDMVWEECCTEGEVEMNLDEELDKEMTFLDWIYLFIAIFLAMIAGWYLLSADIGMGGMAI